MNGLIYGSITIMDTDIRITYLKRKIHYYYINRLLRDGYNGR